MPRRSEWRLDSFPFLDQLWQAFWSQAYKAI